MSEKQLKLFVNYRRADNADFVQHMRTWFMIRYGRENVFMDFDTIPEFARFEDFIREKVREADAVVAVIGPQWLKLMQDKAAAGKPDYVRIELEEALKHGKVIAPICIKDASVPDETLIPPSLRPIFDRNIAQLRDGSDILERIDRITHSLETQIAAQGLARVVIEPTTEAAPKADTFIGVYDAFDYFLEAEQSHDWPKALGWIAKIREMGVNVPVDLGQREARILETLRIEEEKRRRREMADYLYGFARRMKKRGLPAEEIWDVLVQVWQVEPDYDPDDLGGKLVAQVAPQPPKVDFSKAVRDVIGGPFEWIDILGGVVELEDGMGNFTIPDFAIAKYPVTNKQYQTFVDAKDGYTNTKWWDYSEFAQAWRKEHQSPANTAFAGDDLPRTDVCWYDAIAFCRWLEQRTQQKILLPTDQQWQRAAIGDTGWQYPWGNEPPDKDRCNFARNVGQTTPVTQYPKGASHFGIMDMSGNVWEWCLTEFDTDSININTNSPRVVRGGSWRYDDSDFLRAAVRHWFNPDRMNHYQGFRLARSL
ncbi:MAG: SUMF1/EgtB/PvdO family nonheme iron enzyme [Chloroflexi bacterium]|nr:TIR domain-containing protein [Chloroflexota bacterium]NOG64985.1 SUMF1/EgtB/PvdO family nonheme iron enzyme [Chloroflexota bacterium]